MNLECPQCNSPVAGEGQRFCNRCGNDLRAFYEARGVSIPSGSAELPPQNEAPDDSEIKTLEMQGPGDANPADANNAPLVDANIAEPVPIQHTVAIELPDITVETQPPDDTTAQKAMLRILLPSSDVFDRELKKVETQIGKGPRNDIVLADPAVSTSHAVIRIENGTYILKDLGSRNGTVVNGKRITKTETLSHGDVIGMGTTKLTFRLSSYGETSVIPIPDITAPIPNHKLPLQQDSLATILVQGGLLSQHAVDRLRGTDARGRRLYRAVVEEGVVSEVAMRDAMSRAFTIPVTNLGKAEISEPIIAKFSSQLARDRWVFPVEETPQKVILAVADPTDQEAVQEVKSKFYKPIEVRLATATEVREQIDKHFGPKLVGVLPNGDKIEHLINKSEIEIGKATHNDIVLTDPTVSNTHAVILSRDGGFSIVDLGSRNGTFVNGDKLTTHARTLRHGDSVQMGQTLWTFRNLSETPENVTAILSVEALEEVRRRASITSPSPHKTDQQPAVSASTTPQPLSHQHVNTPPVATPVEVTTIPGASPAPPAPGVVANADDDDAADKKKKKKGKIQKEERERIKAAYIRAIGGILATVLSVILTVLLTIYINHSMRQGVQPAPPPGPSTVTPADNRGTKLKLSNAIPSTSFDGGKYEASGALQIPGSEGIYFVDNSKEDLIYWMPLDSSGRQAGTPQAINFGVKVSDPEGIAYGSSFFYVMSSLSFPDVGDQNALVRFALDPQSRTLQGSPEVMTGIREFLISSVPELSAVANLGYDAGGINIEGVAWDSVHERLLLGFRSPQVNGRAFLVPLKLRDPRGPFSTQNLIAPESTIQIPLGNLGIRDIEYDPRAGVFIIIAGSIAQGEAKEFILFEWNGDTDTTKPDSAPKELARLDAKMKPEGVTRVRVGGRDILMVVGDASQYTRFDLVEGQ